MKNLKPFYYLTIFSACIIFLSSCGSFKDQFSHQRYTSFKVKHHSGILKEDQTVSLSVKNNGDVMSKEISSDQKKSLVETLSSINKNAVTADRKESQQEMNVNAMTVNRKQNSFSKVELFKHSFLTAKNKKTSDPDSNTVLFILLCIFIPPLAIYLKDNNVSTLFWITLLLCIFGFGGYFYTAGVGLLWLIAMILAFVHCFKK